MKQALLVFVVVATLFSQGSDAINFLDDTLFVEQKPVYNPVLTTSLSIIPGGGQFATKHWGKGVLHLGLNSIFWSQAIINYQGLEHYSNGISYSDTLNSVQTDLDSIEAQYDLVYSDTTLDSTTQHDSLLVLGKDLLSTQYTYGKIRIDQTWEKRSTQNWFIWAGSMYLWNLMDGYGVANTFEGNTKPSPRRAALLSAIPFSGAGQWYNGSPFKAGLVTATQISFFASAINFSVLRREIEEEGVTMAELARSKADGVDTLFITSQQVDGWRTDYKKAGSIRTQFIWYGVIFYLYGIVDAYVDASLYGFNRKFDITGGYTPGKNEFAFAFSMKF